MKIEVDLSKLKWDTLIDLASDLGCELEYPPAIPINKYTKLLMENIEDKEIFNMWQEEQEKINDDINAAYDQFEEDLLQWYEDHFNIKE